MQSGTQARSVFENDNKRLINHCGLLEVVEQLESCHEVVDGNIGKLTTHILLKSGATGQHRQGRTKGKKLLLTLSEFRGILQWRYSISKSQINYIIQRLSYRMPIIRAAIMTTKNHIIPPNITNLLHLRTWVKRLLVLNIINFTNTYQNDIRDQRGSLGWLMAYFRRGRRSRIRFDTLSTINWEAMIMHH